ncbi:MAG: ATP-binding protein, partial [Candidatus Limnocylindria bacterium]
AVALFLDRAATASPGLRLTEANAPIIAEICRRLDGLPLAIELAASRTRILSPAELARRLDRRLQALGDGGQAGADRQRTLRGTIEWSHELLTAAERTLFARLSVFDGGWSATAAETVAGGPGLDGDPLEVLERLVDQSLVRREPRPDAPRFSMLETIREFAHEQLQAAGETDGLAARHASHFRDLAESAEPHLLSTEAGTWVETLSDETDNLRAALRWSLADTGPARLELGLRLAAAAWRFWQHVGTLSEGREWLDALLARVDAGERGVPYANALLAAGGIAYWQQDYATTTARYEEAAAVAEQLGDRRLLAAAVDSLAYIPMMTGDFDRARELAGRAHDLWLEVGEPFKAALANANAAYLGFFEERYEQALGPMRTMLAEARNAGERYWVVNGLTGIGQLLRLMGEVEESRRHYAQALQLALEDGNLALLTMALEPLSNLESQAGEHERAMRFWAASESIKERMGGGAPPAEMRIQDPRPAAEAAIGPQAAAAALAEGRMMTAAEAVREAAAGAGLDRESQPAAPAG